MEFSSERPVILSYCAAFLRREAWHIYRQVKAVQSFRNVVVTRRRENAEQFPYEDLVLLKKPAFRFLSHWYHGLMGDGKMLSGSEVKQLLECRRKLGAAVVHVYLGSEALRLTEYLRQESCAKVVSFHGADLAHSFSKEDFKKLDAVTDLFLCRSESLREELLQRGCAETKIRLNRTGIPLGEDIGQKKRDITLKKPYNLLQVCRLIEKKGLDVTFKALAELKKQGLPCTLTLAGEGPEEAALRRLAGELGIENEVTFRGFLSQEALQVEFQKADVFVHPSRETESGDREGIPNSLLEAMSWRLPVVSTRHSGIPEVIVSGENGLLLESANPLLLTAALQSLASDESLYEKISANSRQIVEETYSIKACAKALEASYQEVMNRKRGV
jgi:colanic acid/amylovoran biosynthesis glycosyltransferase